MDAKDNVMLLRDEAVEPTANVLKNILDSKLFAVYEELMRVFAAEFNLEPQWRFYKDGKAWLCKVCYKKNTVLWLSVWQNQIKISFYFTEKTRAGIDSLNISSNIKVNFSNAKPAGKLIPLIVDVEQLEHLTDLKEIIKYKKELK
ncbi:MAG: DUF3788 family protein [Bacteroidales bacterium]